MLWIIVALTGVIAVLLVFIGFQMYLSKIQVVRTDMLRDMVVQAKDGENQALVSFARISDRLYREYQKNESHTATIEMLMEHILEMESL